MKIVVLDGYTENPGDLSWDALAQLGDLTVYDFTAPDDAQSRIGDAEAILLNKCPVDEALMAACPKLRYIGVLATGYNVVDVSAAARRGIVVTNIPSYGTQAVAQHVFALLLEVCNHVGLHNQAVQQGRWSSCRDFCFWDAPLMELSGKTMGIIGYGRIGRATAQIARAFGMQVLAAGHAPDSVPLHDVLRCSDVVSLHCPLTEQTHQLINRQILAQMKDGAILINTARGPLVDEWALREALTSGKLRAAAVDVASTEPIPLDSPLLGLPNCVITPHIAWAARESRQRLMDAAVENLRSFQQGHVIHNVAR